MKRPSPEEGVALRASSAAKFTHDVIPRRVRQRHLLFASAAGALGLLVTVYVQQRLDELIVREAEARFSAAVGEVYRNLSQRITGYTDTLRATQAFMTTLPEATEEDFQSYVRALDLPQRYPGFSAITYAKLTRTAVGLSRLTQRMRETYPWYTVQQPAPGELHLPVVYSEPLWTEGLGVDLVQQGGSDALTRMVEGADLVTMRLLLRSTPSGQLSSLPVHLGVYLGGDPYDVGGRRKTFAGSVGAGLDLERLFAGVVSPQNVDRISVEVFDGGTVLPGAKPALPSQETLLYRQYPRGGLPAGSTLTGERVMALGTHQFQLRFSSPEEYWANDLSQVTAVAVLSLGALLSLVLVRTTYLASMSQSRMKLQLDMSRGQLWRLAMFDSLTGLPNRTLFIDRLNTAVSHAERNSSHVCVLFVDLDSFKHVNDTHGHSVGDELLEQAAARLSGCVRHSDTVARLGGDEFAVLLPNEERSHTVFMEIATVAKKVVEQMEQPFLIGGRSLQIGASVGLCSYPEDGKDGSSLLRKADIAMYRAKSYGGHGFQHFSDSLDEAASERMLLEEDLALALKHGGGGLELYFQPKLDLVRGGVASCEALIRWNHPTRGLLTPAKFVSLAEETGQIVAMGVWAIKKADEVALAWVKKGMRITIAVNVSLKQIANEQRMALLLDAVNSVKARGLVDLEITESIAFSGQDRVVQKLLDTAHTCKMKVALDDFGTGYSAMSQLKKLDVDALKIDQQFVRGLFNGPKDRAIVNALLGLAHDLGVTSIAEGVETEEQFCELKRAGCDYAQGYFIAPPLRQADFEAFARSELHPTPVPLHDQALGL